MDMSEENISKNALSDGILANLRPLDNSNMQKVSIAKRSQNKILVAGSVISGIPIFFGKIAVFNANFKS